MSRADPGSSPRVAVRPDREPPGRGADASPAVDPKAAGAAVVRLSEIFTSIQGEGVSAGTPSTFVRLQGCSIGCRWCDTKYTWPVDGGLERSLASVVDDVRGRGVRNVVITGGEPLENPAFVPLVHALAAADFTIEVETAGTVAPSDVPVDQWNVSVKLSNSGVPVGRRVRPEVIRGFAAMPHAWFKFVVGHETDVEEVLDLQRRHGLDAAKMLLMPLGMTTAEQTALMARVAEWCVRHGFRLSPRLHTLIWGARRGV